MSTHFRPVTIIQLLLCAIAMAFCQTSYSQEFFKKYYDVGNGHQSYIQVLPDGSFFTMQNGPIASLILSKYSACGVLVWSYQFLSDHSFGLYTNDVSLLQLDNKMRPVFVTNAFKNGQPYFVVMRFSEDGQRVELAKKFSVPYNLKEVLNFKINKDGDYWIGVAHGWGKGETGTIKLDTAGNILSSYSYEFTSSFLEFTENDSFLAGSDTLMMFVNKPAQVKWRTNYSGLEQITGAAKISSGFVLLGDVHKSPDALLFRINNKGQVITGGQLAKAFISHSLKTDSRGNILSVGWNIITDSLSSEAYPAIMELDVDGHLKRNIQLGTSPDYSNGIFTSIELQKESLYSTAQIVDYVNGSLNVQQMIARMSMEEVNFFCSDTSVLELASPHLVTATFQNSPITSPLPLTDSTFKINSLAHSFITTWECNAVRDFSKLFTVDSLIMCRGDFLDITRPGLHGTSFRWSNGDTTETIRADTAGPYWVAMTFPCDPKTYYDTVYVTLYPEPDFDININPKRTDIGKPIEYTYQSASSSEVVSWSFGDGTSSINRFSTHSYSASGQYIVTTTILTEDSCVIEVTDTIHINKQLIEVPNVFTPNGDGQNDLMTIKGEDIADYTLNIYNRYGVLVKSQQNLPWDGNTENRQSASDGVYYYVLNYTLYDGFTGSKSGSVTLFRNSTR